MEGNNEKEIKSEKDPTPTSTRLQSLRLPRNLNLAMLSAVKPKKQYAPNLNVVRNKDRQKELLASAVTANRRGADSNRRQRKPANHQDSKYIQQEGVFSQGGASDLKQPSSSSGYSSRHASTASRRGATATTATRMAMKNEEDVKNEESDEDDELSLKALTLDAVETAVLTDDGADGGAVKAELDDDAAVQEYFLNDKIYSEDQPGLCLVRLPDSFAGKGFSDDPTKTGFKKYIDFPLGFMGEGKIGKMVLKKSGAVELCISGVYYKLGNDDTFDCREELASVKIREDEQQEQQQQHASTAAEHVIASLGLLSKHFMLYPDFDSIL